MPMRKLALLVTVLLASCSSVPTTMDAVEIRIANESGIRFDQVIVGFPAGQEDYGAIPARSSSGYRRIERAYRYAFIEVQVAGRKLVLQPIDYVGESLLEDGRYTYVLDVDEVDPDHLILSLRNDR